MSNKKKSYFTTPDDNVFREETKPIFFEQLKSIHFLYKYMNIEGIQRMLENPTLKFTHPSNFNDPFDCYNKIVDFSNPTNQYLTYLVDRHFSYLSFSQRNKKFHELKSRSHDINLSIKNLHNYKICCFTTICDNLLMWAHYANSHTGCCITFDLTQLYITIKLKYDLNYFYPINYKKEFTSINYFNQPLRTIITWQTTKSEDWAYEKEIRVIIVDNFINNDHLFLPIDAKSFKAIYLGCKIDPEKKKKIIDICSQKYPHMKIYQMTLAENKFELHPVLVEINK